MDIKFYHQYKYNCTELLHDDIISETKTQYIKQPDNNISNKEDKTMNAQIITEEDQKVLCEKISSFEEKNGTEMLLMTFLSAINRVLVDKGITSELELKNYFERELEIQSE